MRKIIIRRKWVSVKGKWRSWVKNSPKKKSENCVRWQNIPALKCNIGVILRNVEYKCATKGIVWLACPSPVKGGKPVAYLWVPPIPSSTHCSSLYLLFPASVLEMTHRVKASKSSLVLGRPKNSRLCSQHGFIRYIIHLSFLYLLQTSSDIPYNSWGLALLCYWPVHSWRCWWCLYRFRPGRCQWGGWYRCQWTATGLSHSHIEQHHNPSSHHQVQGMIVSRGVF